MATIHHLAQASLEVLQVIVSGKKVLQGKTWKKNRGRRFRSEGKKVHIRGRRFKSLLYSVQQKPYAKKKGWDKTETLTAGTCFLKKMKVYSFFLTFLMEAITIGSGWFLRVSYGQTRHPTQTDLVCHLQVWTDPMVRTNPNFNHRVCSGCSGSRVYSYPWPPLWPEGLHCTWWWSKVFFI